MYKTVESETRSLFSSSTTIMGSSRIPGMRFFVFVLSTYLDKVTTGHEMARKKICKVKEKSRSFIFLSGKIDILKTIQGKLK